MLNLSTRLQPSGRPWYRLLTMSTTISHLAGNLEVARLLMMRRGEFVGKRNIYFVCWFLLVWEARHGIW